MKREFVREDFSSVAKIHCDAIRSGFLSSLGWRFLSLLYESIDKSEGSVLIVFRDKGKIGGFVSATKNIGEVYKILLKSPFRLVFALLPALFSPSRAFKIFETVVFSKAESRGGERIVGAELLSIAVLDDYRGRGFAEKLFNELVCHFRFVGVKKFNIIVGESLQPAHCFYTKMGAKPVSRVQVHKGVESVGYVFNIE